MTNKYQQAFKYIQNAKNILLVTHYRPDGDALSSLAAMIGLMENLGKNFTAWCQDRPPEQFSFLPYFHEIKNARADLDFYERDLVISVDCGSIGRTKIQDLITSRSPEQIFIEFDHHPQADDSADLAIRQPELSSTAEVLYNFFKANQIKISKDAANCFLAGIMTDTGNLLYQSTTKETVRIASELLRLGARLPAILENTWRNKSLKAMKVWGRAMDRLIVNERYQIALTALDHEEIVESGATDEEFEGISGFLSNLSGARLLLFLREETPGEIRGSLRGIHPDSNVTPLAKILGGGGHAKASGFVLPGHIEKNGNSWKIV